MGGELDSSRSSTEIFILNDEGMLSCEPDTNVLCLNEDRFRVEIDWATPNGESGRGNARPLSGNSGLFWFFSSDNAEMLVKVLNGCQISGAEADWIFFAATTNLEYKMR